MIKVERKADTLVITVDINKDMPMSSTGKTKQVASSHGNQATSIIIDGKPVYVGMNAYVKA